MQPIPPQSKADAAHSEPAAELQLYDMPQMLQAYAPSRQLSQQSSRLGIRPSNVTAQRYEQVTRAYIQAVHSVLTGQKGAPEAAAELEKQLIQITGFRPSPPKTSK